METNKQGRIFRRSDDGEYVLVYCHANLEESVLRWPEKNELSALVVTKEGEVFGAGVNSMVGGSEAETAPMKDGGGGFLQNYEKVDTLCGLSVKKIVVGLAFGAALTSKNDVMVWGRGSLDPSDVVSFKKYRVYGSSCKKCPPGTPFGYLTSLTIGNVKLECCQSCRQCVRVDSPGGDSYSESFVRYRENGYKFSCSKCNEPTSGYQINDIKVHYCYSCQLVFDLGSFLQVRTPKMIYKLARAKDEIVIDVACTGLWICMLFDNNKVVLRNCLTGVEYLEPQQTDTNATSVKKVAVYGGRSGMFFVSEEGALYKCLINGNGSFAVTKVELPAAVRKVCCGMKTSAALLDDGSLWFIADAGTTYPLYRDVDANAFADVAVLAMTDAFLVQAFKETKDEVLNVQFASTVSEIIVKIVKVDLPTVLKEMVRPNAATQNLVAPIPNMAQLYGKPHLADLTIKLADGELPAHSCVLFGTSAHFKDTFGPSKLPPKVLDMSEYNPRAYRYLVQYFYQLEPDDLDAEDFVDLRQIATGYGETAVAEVAKAKIKAKLTADNVLQILERAKHHDFKDLMSECENLMRSPAFTDKLLQMALGNMPRP